jgi:hypothetical protein
MSLSGRVATWVTEHLLNRAETDIVELGTAQFKRIRAGLEDGRPCIRDLTVVPAPDSLVFSPALGLSIFDPEAFRNALLALFPGKNRGSNYVTLVLPDGLFHTGFLSMNNSAFRGGIQPIVEREVQGTAPRAFAEYRILFEAGLPVGPKRNLLFCCLSHEVQEELRGFLESIGKIPVAIVPSFISAFGLIRQVEKNESPHPSIFIHIGHEASTIAIVLGGLIRRIQILSIGSVDFTRALSKGLSISLVEAEHLKRTQEILLPEPTSDEQVQVAAYQILEPLFSDFLQKTYRFLQTHSADNPAEGSFRRILLSGGGSNLRHIDALITGNLGLPTTFLGALTAPTTATGETPLPRDQANTLAPLLGALYLKPWNHEAQERMVA